MGASVSPRGGGGGKRRRGHAKNRPMAEINVTPFVDVMLGSIDNIYGCSTYVDGWCPD